MDQQQQGECAGGTAGVVGCAGREGVCADDVGNDDGKSFLVNSGMIGARNALQK